MARLVSFNVNGIRSRTHQLEALQARHDPDVVGIQESKVADEFFPAEAMQALGWRSAYHGQKGHYGVALLSKRDPLRVIKGFPDDGLEAQRRAITGLYGLDDGTELTIVNGYFPQGESRAHPVKFPSKQQFYADLMRYLDERFSPSQALIVMGDMNVAPQEADIGIGADNAKRWLRTGKCSFLPEERDWLRRLMEWGLFDAYRHLHPDRDDGFSWFDYRSRGFEREPKRGLRIDLILVSAPVRERLRDAGIDYTIRALERPSDHCPIWIDLD
ncbi:exodeoxyribonuclease III [Halochromatium salexigens]|uniref:Exodeoxyribonuclease III n=1 Tax=Halochromatium salexigens TaxID=49447 RepID=A0AAJ0UEV9_HALSE|nr:exodeoxyribonuclease III [Halochromatium salexigens]MBK5930038.1 exodeoxyribonuclease III [Halochromatium salexigens]